MKRYIRPITSICRCFCWVSECTNFSTRIKFCFHKTAQLLSLIANLFTKQHVYKEIVLKIKLVKIYICHIARNYVHRINCRSQYYRFIAFSHCRFSRWIIRLRKSLLQSTAISFVFTYFIKDLCSMWLFYRRIYFIGMLRYWPKFFWWFKVT